MNTPDQPTPTATSRTIEQAAQECAPDCIDAVLSLKPELQLAYVAQLIAAALREVVERELSSAQAALAEAKAEVARLKESYNGACYAEDVLTKCVSTAEATNDQLRARVAELEHAHNTATQSIANAHAAIDESGIVMTREKTHQGLTPRVKSIIARHHELEADKARLDWLEAHHNWLLCAETESPTFSCGSNENFQNWALKVATVRAAIDAAKGQP